MSGIVDYTSKIAVKIAVQGAKTEARATLVEAASTAKIAAQQGFLGVVHGAQKIAGPIQSGCEQLNSKVESNSIIEKLVQGATKASSCLEDLSSTTSARIEKEKDVKDRSKITKIIGRSERTAAVKADFTIEGTSMFVQGSSGILKLSEAVTRGTGAVLQTVGAVASNVVEAISTSHLLNEASNALAPIASTALEGSKKMIAESGTRPWQSLLDTAALRVTGTQASSAIAEIGTQTFNRLPHREAMRSSGARIAITVDNAFEEVGRIGSQVADKLPLTVDVIRTEMRKQTEGAIDSLIDMAQQHEEAPITKIIENATKELVTDSVDFVTQRLLGDDAPEFRKALERIANRETAPYKTKIKNGLNKARKVVQKPIRSLSLCFANSCGRLFQQRYIPVPFERHPRKPN